MLSSIKSVSCSDTRLFNSPNSNDVSCTSILSHFNTGETLEDHQLLLITYELLSYVNQPVIPLPSQYMFRVSEYNYLSVVPFPLNLCTNFSHSRRCQNTNPCYQSATDRDSSFNKTIPSPGGSACAVNGNATRSESLAFVVEHNYMKMFTSAGPRRRLPLGYFRVVGEVGFGSLAE